jgi:glycosyltransferase 2 family protein
MTSSPRIPAPAGPSQVRRAVLAWPGSRYRHPGQVIRLLAASVVLAVTAAIATLGPASLLSHGGGPASGAVAVLIIAGLAAAVTAAGPWLSRPWWSAAWVTVLLICAVLVITGGLSVLELVLALAAGVAGGTGFLVGYGVPDRRLGPAGVAAALRTAGVPVRRVTPAAVTAKGSRPFRAETDAGPPLFVKVFGRENRDADLLYRAYRAIRLRGVGDTRPASSLAKAVEHEALLAVMAERAGAAVPRVGQMIKAGDGSVLLTMEYVAGQPLDAMPGGCVTDQLARDVWHEVAVLHQAGIAHRSLRGANIMVGDDGCPRIVDFSFAELAATGRHRAIDVAELLTSLAGQIGPARAVGTALPELGRAEVASAVPLLQPLALSAGTRRGIKGQDGLLKQTRTAAMAASGELAETDLAQLQRVRPRTLLTIAALAGAFYYLLPQIADVSSSWHALLSARWAWLPLVILFSAVTYLASAIALIGGVPGPVPLGPTTAAQLASSFINRVSPANVGGMALNARFLRKAGSDTSASVAAVSVNSLVGAVVHGVLIVVFFALARRNLSHAFKLPSGSKILLIFAVLLAVAGLVLATRPARRWARTQLVPGLRSALRSLRRAAASPVKICMLVGGSALITLAYIGGLAASVEAFTSRGPSLAVIGAVYLGAAALAAAAPTPGGLGAIEAALIAGLIGVGLAAGPAVSAVLLYRLTTYWLPIVPGWLAWRWLQRKEYL